MRKIIDAELLKLIDQGKSQREVAKHFSCSEPAISQRLKKIRERLPTALQELTPKRQSFAIALATGQTKTEAAALSFNVSTVDSARTIGKRLAADSDIQTAISEILQRNGLTKQYRVNRLRELVDSLDEGVVHRALDMTFKLDGSYSPENHNVNVRTYEALVEDIQSLEQARREAKARKDAALKQIAILEAQDKSKGEKP